MLRHTLTLGLLLLGLSWPALATGKLDAEACRAMQATIAPRQAEIAKLTELRAASAIRAEDAGVNWEDSEIHRLVSAEHAAMADRKLAAYEAAKQQFAKDEMALQSTVRSFNADVSIFNARCSSKG